MPLVDIVMLVLLAAALAAGLARGLVASVGALAGIIAGGAAALWAAPVVGRFVADPTWRAVTVFAVWLGLIVLGAIIGGGIGSWVRRGVDRTPLKLLDRVLGGAAGVVVAALMVSLAAGAVVSAGIPGVSAAVASSSVTRTIDGLIPTPLQGALARVRGSLAADGLPAVGALLDPRPAEPAAPVPLSDSHLQQASRSVARISGVAYACGLSLTGSGFAVAPDAVVTNAHVVAGVRAPLVELPGHAAREGRIVYFNPDQDLAVIRVPGLDAVPLRLSAPLPAGAAAVVTGYPYGGPLTTGDARVLSAGTVRVPDIYGTDPSPRAVYSLAAVVRPGNSGGPLLTADGQVAGVVFARVENRSDRGYAIADAALSPVVARLGSFTAAVASGHCVR